MKGIIYKWTNKTTNESYIGQTTREAERMYDHITAKDDSQFHVALRKYGVDNFYYDVIERDVEEEQLNAREKYWIDYYDSFNNGYNETPGGDCLWRDKDIKKKMVEGIIKANPWRNNVGKKHTQEHKDKISKGNIGKHTGKTHTAETKHKISIASAGQNNGMYGKHHSEETKKKIGAAHIGKPSYNKGVPMKASTKAKLSVAHKGKKQPAGWGEAHAAKLRGRHRVYHNDGTYHYE